MTDDVLWEALLDAHTLRARIAGLRHRIRKLRQSRDYWRARAADLERQPPNYNRRLREITESRDRWRERCLGAEQLLRAERYRRKVRV